MKRIIIHFTLLCCAMLVASPVAPAQKRAAKKQTPAPLSLQLKSTMPMPDVRGRIDHMDVNLPRGQVLLAALENNTIEIFDLNQRQWQRSIAISQEPQGMLYMPLIDRWFVTNAVDGTCSVLSGETCAVVETITGLEDADNIRYDAMTRRIYAGFGRGRLAVIDPMKLAIVKTLPLGSHPESFQIEKNGRRIFVNLPAEKKIAVFDKTTNTLVTEWPLRGASGNYPMALDEEHHRLFVGCRTPARLLVLDTESGKIVATVNIGKDVDDVFLDAARNRIYASCGEGAIHVIARSDPDSYKFLEKIPTRPGARTSLFVPTLGLYLVAVPRQGAKDAEMLVFAAE